MTTKRLVVYDGAGAIRWHVDGYEDHADAGELPVGLAALEVGLDVTGRTHRIVDGAAVPIGAASPAEVEAARLEEIRTARAQRLAASDWTQVADAPLSAERRAAWAAYRQALRDLPAQPAGASWPDPPA